MSEPHMEQQANVSEDGTTVVLPGGAPETSVEAVATTATSSHRRKDHWLALSVAVLSVSVLGYASLMPSVREVAQPPVVTAEVVVPMPERPSVENPFKTVALQAKAVIVYDIEAQQPLFEKRADTSLPLASVTKLMTALVAMESMQADASVAIAQHAIETEGDSGLFAGESWRLRDLIGFTLLSSSNDGADAIAASVGGLWQTTPETVPAYKRIDTFVDKMNLRARELSLSQTHFYNATGLDQYNGKSGAMGSARDIADLITFIWRTQPAILEDTTIDGRTYTSLDGFTHEAENTNEYAMTTPGMLGSKTGFTDLAGGNLAVIYNAGLNRPIAIVVLGSTADGRFNDTQLLMDAAYEYVQSGWYEYEVAGSTPTA